MPQASPRGPSSPAAAPDQRAWRGGRTQNHWPVVGRGHIDTFRIEGTGVDVPLLKGDVATVLTYVARRFAYEIDMLRPGDVESHTVHRAVGTGFESNHLSGTAISIRPLFYPPERSRVRACPNSRRLSSRTSSPTARASWAGADTRTRSRSPRPLKQPRTPVFTGCPQVEYAYSGARPSFRRTIGSMLWSDPENEPPEDLRDMQDMLRRLGVLLALAMVIAMILLGIR